MTSPCQHAFFGAPRSLAKRLHDVLAFKVGVVGKDLIDAVAGSGVATIMLAGRRTIIMLGGEESRAA